MDGWGRVQLCRKRWFGSVKAVCLLAWVVLEYRSCTFGEISLRVAVSAYAVDCREGLFI